MTAPVKPAHLKAAQVALLGVEFSHPAILDAVERNIAEGFADLEATVEARVGWKAYEAGYDKGMRDGHRGDDDPNDNGNPYPPPPPEAKEMP